MTQPGGWARTEELGASGFQHDRWSSLHPAFVGGPAWAELGPDLRRHGLEYVTAPLATASSLSDGRTALRRWIRKRSRLSSTGSARPPGGMPCSPRPARSCRRCWGCWPLAWTAPRPRRRLPVCSATAERARCPSASCSPGRLWIWSAATSSPRSCDCLRHPGPCTSAPAPRTPPAPFGPSLPWRPWPAATRPRWAGAAAWPTRSSAWSPSAAATCSATSRSISSWCATAAPSASAPPLGPPSAPVRR
jgi:hypothetical protein